MSNPNATARLLIDPPQSGSWNMAVDQALLESVAESGELVIRFYQWSEPTLSLGYFQKLADRTQHATSRRAAILRRASGGGAILHDRELTYSLALPADYSVRQSHGLCGAQPLYRAAHESLIAVLAGLGVDAGLCACGDGPPPGDPPAFMCFARRCEGDVLLKGEKIAGSAQRRYRRGVLQHGSILLAASNSAPELPGIGELASVALTGNELAELWLPRLANYLGVACQPSELTDSERARSRELQVGRYDSEDWTARK